MRSCSYDSLAAHPSEAATKIKHTQIAHYRKNPPLDKVGRHVFKF
jgi:hypothetical protein